jgi:sulfhydrogenase subunit delta
MPIAANKIPTISVHSLTGCAGELLVILENLESMLPFVRLASFPFAQTENDNDCPIDIAFVEGSVSQPHDLEKLENIRARAKWLVAVGNCAVWGCVQHASPLTEHVKVDVRLSGCPIDKTQLMSLTASLLQNHLPYVTHKPVCLECKLKENGCVLIENNLPCLGPITAAGCGALCPTLGAACYGCWGPCEDPQMDAMATILAEKGYRMEEVLTRIHAFGAPATLFERSKETGNGKH